MCHLRPRRVVVFMLFFLFAPGATGSSGPRLFTINVTETNTNSLPKAHTWYAFVVSSELSLQSVVVLKTLKRKMFIRELSEINYLISV